MQIKPLADRVVIKMVEAEETTAPVEETAPVEAASSQAAETASAKADTVGCDIHDERHVGQPQGAAVV